MVLPLGQRRADAASCGDRAGKAVPDGGGMATSGSSGNAPHVFPAGQGQSWPGQPQVHPNVSSPLLPPSSKPSTKAGAKGASGGTKVAKPLPSTVIATPIQSASGQGPSHVNELSHPATATGVQKRQGRGNVDEAPEPERLPPPSAPTRLKGGSVTPYSAAAIRVGIRAKAIQERLFSSVLMRYTAHGPGLEAVTVREPAHFTVEALSEDGSRMTTGGEPIVVTIRGVSRVRARVTDNEDGTYSVVWKPTVSGHYNIMISVMGVSIDGCPFNVMATTPEPYPPSCELRGKALTRVTARETHSFEVSFKDKLGAVTHAVDLDVFVEPVRPGSPRARESARIGEMSERDRSPSSLPAEQIISKPKSSTRGFGRKPSSRRIGASPTTHWSVSAQKNAAVVSTPLAPQSSAIIPQTPDTICSSEEQTRHRTIRVKVGDKGLIVRASADRHSEVIGQLLPGAIVTVVEERFARNVIRGRIALDFMGKVDSQGRKTERGSTFRSVTGDTFRANATEPLETPSPSSSTFRGGSTNRSGDGSTSRQSAPSPGEKGTGDSMKPAATRHARREVFTSPKPRVGGGYAWDSPLSSASSSLQASRTISRPRSDRLGMIPETTPSEADKPLGFNAEELGYSVRGLHDAVRRVVPENEEGGSYETFEEKVGAHHDKIQQRWSMQLATPKAVGLSDAEPSEISERTPLLEETPPMAPLRAADDLPSTMESPWMDSTPKRTGARESQDEFTPGRLSTPRTGWVTLVKDGVKLVSSRIKLDPNSRWQHKDMWQRRVGNNYKPGAALQSEAGLTPRRQRKKLLMELQADPNSFAFGGVYPGTVHSHGKLHDTHRVSFSIGVAGQYLLHVRLRNQAAALPGSPFLLTVDPGSAFALSTFLPPGSIQGEVGKPITLNLLTSDAMGNPCSEGGSQVTSAFDITMSSFTKSTVTDCGDGTYDLTWVITKTGEFKANVSIEGKLLPNSPAIIHVCSTYPDISRTELLESSALSEAVVGMKTPFTFRFRDQWDNYVIPTPEFRRSFKLGFSLLKGKEKVAIDGNVNTDELCEGGFLEDNASYEGKYVAKLPGHFDLHLYAFLEGNLTERHMLPGSPFHVLVGKNNRQENEKKDGRPASRTEIKDDGQQQELSDMFMTAPQDYKIDMAVFDAAQARWGECTIDAFASPATHLLPRYWTQKKEQASEHVDALSDPLRWKKGERIWAHPMPWQLDALVKLLERPERCAEVIVVAPSWRNAKKMAPGDWLLTLSKLCDEKVKYTAGRLHKVADDAPERIEEWPLQIYHIPAREKEWLGAPPRVAPSPPVQPLDMTDLDLPASI